MSMTRGIEVTGIADADQMTAELAVMLRDGGRSEAQSYELAQQVRDRYRAAFSDWEPERVPTVWVSTTSHRSRQELVRITGDPGHEYGVWPAHGFLLRGAYYEVPAHYAAELCQVKGIRVLRGRPAGGRLFQRWD